MLNREGAVMGKWLGPPHAEIRRCGAKTRPGHPCGLYAMSNGRCRLHGGMSTGAYRPHRPLKHGFYTKRACAERRLIIELLRSSKMTVANINN